MTRIGTTGPESTIVPICAEGKLKKQIYPRSLKPTTMRVPIPERY
ncbi:hypothetical protein BVRB_2g028170 [Beta vulgaris subsp. vulgaris]|nr:hypothetical protein BVRB_2g028170 [Beta vulgaris subsp. vulgaris]